MSATVTIVNDVINISLANTGPQGTPGAGIAAGGTAGQFLTKNSAYDFDTRWQRPSTASLGSQPDKNARARSVV